MAKKQKVTKYEKVENFKRLALGRTNKVLKGLSLLGNLTSSRYISTQDELDKIIDTIQEGLDVLRLKFKPKVLTLDFDEEED